MAKYVGVDGCAAGWLAVWRKTGQPKAAIYTRFEDLVADHSDAKRLLVDMPIGLMDSEDRQIESEVRSRLGRRRSSVFPVPCHSAAYASTYDAANALNRKQISKGLSKQAWFITPKIREVNDFLIRFPGYVGVVGECHPELAFATLAGEPMTHGKKTEEGAEERLHLISTQLPKARAFIDAFLATTQRKSVVRDDCLDALVLMLSAKTAQPMTTSASQMGMNNIPIRMWIPGHKV